MELRPAHYQSDRGASGSEQDPEQEVTPALQEGLPIPEGVDESEFSLASLYHPLSKYTPEQKMRVVAEMLIWEDSLKVEKLTGVNAATIRWWKTQAVWWPAAVDHCRRNKNDELDAVMTRVMHKAMSNVEDIIENGEDVVTKTGQIVKKMPGLQHQVMAAAILQDKREGLRAAPGVKDKKNSDEVLEKLLKGFEDLSQEIRSKKDPRVINE
jgi:hypothetical protein